MMNQGHSLGLDDFTFGLDTRLNTALTANGVAQAIQKWNGRVGLSILFKLF
jgi:hypothetical protein